LYDGGCFEKELDIILKELGYFDERRRRCASR
jgi:hypothetical protein